MFELTPPLLGPLTLGNSQADLLMMPIFKQAYSSHQFLHQSARSLKRRFNITKSQTTKISQVCPSCQQVSAHQPPSPGVNPRGLTLNEIWQMDVTHFPEFGRLNYLPVSINTYSHMLWASTHPGETTIHAQCHFLATFAHMGSPRNLKLTMGPLTPVKVLKPSVLSGLLVILQASHIIQLAKLLLNEHIMLLKISY